jgi:hypothetical protein
MNPEPFIEDIILKFSRRGMERLRPYLSKRYCEDAAKEILSWQRGPVLLATGFYVAGHAETDGPAGTVVLAKALQKLGFAPFVLTDENCSHYFEPEGLDTIYMSYEEGEDFCLSLLADLQPSGLISIERCGRNAEGDYANMHGESIRSHTAQIDRLFDAAYGKVPTIGVGDGGNEIGMGNLADVIEQELSLVPCRTKTDRLVIATVSNWGAYGIAAYLQILSGVPVFPPVEEVKTYLAQTVELGSVDGMSEENVCRVDGFSLAESEEVYAALQEAVTSCTVPSGTPG